MAAEKTIFNEPARTQSSPWVSYAGWMVVGIFFAIGFFILGWLLLAPVILVGVAFAFDKSSRRGLFGFALGAGIGVVGFAFLLLGDDVVISAFVMGASLMLVGVLGQVRRTFFADAR